MNKLTNRFLAAKLQRNFKNVCTHTIILDPMNNVRIQLLRQFIREEPADPFNVYALAMEFLSDAPAQAQLLFDQLLTEHPDYLPTYYHAAALYAELGERERTARDKAAQLYEQGMALAHRQGNEKTFLELQRAKRAFDDDDEW